MIDQQHDAQTAFPSVLGVLGVAGVAFLACVAGGFLLAALVCVAVWVIYHLLAIAIYIASYLVALWRLDRAIAAARADADVDVDELPEALPASRLIWSDRTVAA